MLTETRIPQKVKIKGPFILFHHSMSGIEALYWASNFPEEVEGIVGLDVAVPEVYDHYVINQPMIHLASFGSSIAITRFFPSVVENSAEIKYGTLDQQEKNIYLAVFYRRTLTKSMLNEIKEIKKNATLLNSLKKPELPMLFFTSNGEGTGWDKKVWIDAQKNCCRDLANVNLIELESNHYIHNISYELIAKESKSFLENLHKDFIN